MRPYIARISKQVDVLFAASKHTTAPINHTKPSLGTNMMQSFRLTDLFTRVTSYCAKSSQKLSLRNSLQRSTETNTNYIP